MRNRNVNQLKMGVVLSYVNLALGSLIPFFYTPLMLNMLGQAEYGLYSLSNSVVGYLSILNLGFGSTIIRYIAKYRAEDNKDAIQRTFGFSLLIYIVMGIVVLICGVLLSQNAGLIFSQGLTVQEISKMKVLILLMSVNMMISFPLSVFSSVTVAYERYIFRRIIDMMSTVAIPIVNLIALYLGFASVGMALSSTMIQVILLPVNCLYCLRVLHVHPSFKRIPVGLMKEMLSFSLVIFIDAIVDMLFWSTDKVILGMRASSIAVAIYNVAVTFNNMIITLSSSISGVLTPKIVGMVTKDAPTSELSSLFIRVGRLQYLIIALVVPGYILFGRQFLNLWAGPEYAQSYWIALLTIVPLCIPLIQNTGLSILIAENKYLFRCVTYLIIAVVNMISTYLIVPYLGGIGAALCSCCSYVLGQGLIMNLYYHKCIHLDIPAFWRNIFKMSVVPVGMLIIGFAIQKYIPLQSWAAFFAGVIFYSAIYAVLMYRFVLNAQEKSMLLGKIRRQHR